MKLIDFITQFPDEESCKQKFKEYGDQVGVICPKCGGGDYCPYCGCSGTSCCCFDPDPIVCDCCGSEVHSHCDFCDPDPIICDCCGAEGHSSCNLCNEVPNNEPEPEPEICNNSFDFNCISRIRSVTEEKTFKSGLWTAVLLSFDIFLAVYDGDYIASILDETFSGVDFLSYDRIKVRLLYKMGTRSSWSGELEFTCSGQIITNKYNENIYNEYTANLSDNATIQFFKVNILSGVEVKVYEDFDTVEGNYIPLTTIDRDGIPEIGEPVFLRILLLKCI